MGFVETHRVLETQFNIETGFPRIPNVSGTAVSDRGNLWEAAATARLTFGGKADIADVRLWPKAEITRYLRRNLSCWVSTFKLTVTTRMGAQAARISHFAHR